MTRCRRPGCPGTIDDTGFCDVCGLQPAEPAESAAEPDPGWTDGDRADTGFGELPPIGVKAPESQVRTNPEVPEPHRVCGRCRAEVGRSTFGRPALASGFCPRCGTPFSFVPRLRRGDRLGHYEVVDPLAHGGVGWVYLGRDTHLDGRHVAIKGLINENDPETVEAAVNERKHLIALDHENIVRIHDFVIGPGSEADRPAGYIVMEYVGGKSLQDIKKLARLNRRTLPVEDVVTYGLQILDALAYLHARGLVYCDLKPGNVIHRDRRIKLIDLGAVCERGYRGDVWVTERYTVPESERRSRGMRPDMDLYSLGVTLKELLVNSPEGRPPGARGALRAGLASLELALTRATEPDWRRRFPSAEEMREQFEGILRQIAALRGTELPPKPSSRFAPAVELLDAELYRPPPLSRWTGPADETALETDRIPDSRPLPPRVALELPAPLPDPRDPAAGFLATATTGDPRRLLAELDGFRGRSIEAGLVRCRVHLALAWQAGEAQEFAAAATALEEAGDLALEERRRREAAQEPAEDWRIHWHTALLALYRRKSDEAAAAFEEVRRILPGELVPRLALGYCAEVRDRPSPAAAHYAVVWRTDRTEASAAFGLARTHLAGPSPDRDAAVSVVDSVGPASKHYDAARTAAIRLRAGRIGEAGPGAADLEDAVRRLAVPGHDRAGRARLVTLVRQAALGLLADGSPELPEGEILGSRVTGPGLRLLLEDSLRELAAQATDDDEHDTLIDLANTVRPRSRW
ncbi:protein kinase [Amycolatopsis cynarae]|uniref:non-specific serine/threonine protein kinase n=1 Tax=Amycolatopsis cynarae TaxID=2995223 RepID=A0ABY7B702_9PSEU|nr:serine/threonine-protein kinase [Amycolatopsis sp. HUAS 11-8]WAL68111.1 protein kinase [Amycolatopsis sp. HUAS 11-8]